MSYRKMDFWTLGILIVAVILVIIFISSILFSGAPYQNSISNLAINQNESFVTIGHSNYFISLIKTSQNKYAYISIQKPPISLNPKLVIELLKGTVIPININKDSNYSNVEIELNNISTNTIYLSIKYINTSLDVPINNSAIFYLNSSSIYSYGTTTIPQLSNSTNNSKNNTSTKTTTLTTQTTTIPSQNNNVLSILKGSPSYALMLNYSLAYAQAKEFCTSSLYNSTYESYVVGVPKGPNSYRNVTNVAPHNMSMNISSGNGGIYTVIFKTISNNPSTTGDVAIFQVSMNSDSITSTQFVGIFSGLDYTQLYNSYQSSIKVGNSCGIFIN